mmetsp:Transcript_17100/g.42876  ORF Transcript_17100/g.42876 Transcript_17100/m.42876 type:complete len:242 (+) Transcript_17100:141-866(+)
MACLILLQTAPSSKCTTLAFHAKPCGTPNPCDKTAGSATSLSSSVQLLAAATHASHQPGATHQAIRKPCHPCHTGLRTCSLPPATKGRGHIFNPVPCATCQVYRPSAAVGTQCSQAVHGSYHACPSLPTCNSYLLPQLSPKLRVIANLMHAHLPWPQPCLLTKQQLTAWCSPVQNTKNSVSRPSQPHPQPIPSCPGYVPGRLEITQCCGLLLSCCLAHVTIHTTPYWFSAYPCCTHSISAT